MCDAVQQRWPLHATQYKQGKIDGTPLSVARAEVEAKEKLLRHAKTYKLTPFEIDATKKLLALDRKNLDKLLEENNYAGDSQSRKNK